MSYEKAMRHTRNVRKVKAQSRMYLGFDTGSGAWPNPRRNPETAAYIELRDWFRQRHHGDKQHNRECVREAVQRLRDFRQK